jgi:dihydrofolate synthase / folylpolyglutamate synthase
MQKIDSLLEELTGKEFFKGGFERLIPLFSPFQSWLTINKTKIITISGTNGKGETVYFLEQFFKNTQLTTASFSSPHIISVTERMKLNGTEISESLLLENLMKCRDEVIEFSLSYYELLFLCFLKFIKNNKPIDVLILEVGLGGRLDAVNLLNADISAVTSISRDHQEILGNGLSKILKEKLGIIRKGQLLFTSLEQEYLRNIVTSHIQGLSITHKDLFELQVSNQQTHYKMRNYNLAKAIFKTLSLCSIPCFEHMAPSKGRGELMTLGSRSFIFVGAHNVDGMRKMTQYMVGSSQDETIANKFQKIIISFSKRTDEEIIKCIEILLKSPCLYQKIIVTTFNHYKAVEEVRVEKIINHFYTKDSANKKRLSFVKKYNKILNNENEDSKILVTGSYYFIGEYQQYLKTLC